MNSREKTLSGLIVGIAVIGATYYGWTKVDAMLQSRRDTVANLEKEISEYELTMHRDRKMAIAMKEMKARSLPPTDTPQRNYDKWLTTTAVESGIEIKEKKDPVRARQAKNAAYASYTFAIDGVATIESLTTFLHKLYSSNDLHKVGSWRFKPIAGTNKLDVDITVEAIAIPGAPERKEVGNLVSDQLKGRNLDEFIASIVQRNLFAPANQSPVMKSLGKETVEKGKFLRFDVADKTSDPDKDDTITYAMVEGPEGARINEATGSLRWLAKNEMEPGEYTITVSATDSGFPAKSATEELTVIVKDPPPKVVKTEPPPKPKFDEAKHAHLTAVVENDGEKQLWIHIRTTGETLKLSKGDEIKIGTIEGTLTEIELKWVEIETADGPIIVKAGKMLDSGKSPDDRTALR
ncbi:cadherin repeat domain-containing protein [Planctomycetota bacterium]